MSNYVLVHGAWSDASAWDEVARLLRGDGHQVAAPDLPAHGKDTTDPALATLDGYADTVIAAAQSLGGPVVLVGHSMAGTVVSTVAEKRPDLTSRLIYLAAFLLPSGQSLYGFTQTSPGMATAALGPALRPGEGVLGVDPDQFIDVFCADAPTEIAAAALAGLRPDPLAPMGTPVSVTEARWGSVPRGYIHTAADRCVPPAAQQEMVDALPVAATRTVPAAHLAILSHPEQVTAAITELTPNHPTPSTSAPRTPSRRNHDESQEPPVNPISPKRVAIVISNPAASTTTGWPVGFWWSELSYPYYRFTELGYQVESFSPDGGGCVADAMSDPEDASQWQAEDVISRGYKHDPAFTTLIENTRSVDEISLESFDAIVVAGGQGPMFTMEHATNLHQKFVEFFEAGKIAAALCRGVAVLRYATLSTGEPLVAGRTITGFANIEEDFADEAVWSLGALPRGTHVMPWRIEDEMTKLGANYIQAGLWKGFAIRDGNLITGQQNFSGAETAEAIVGALGE